MNIWLWRWGMTIKLGQWRFNIRHRAGSPELFSQRNDPKRLRFLGLSMRLWKANT